MIHPDVGAEHPELWALENQMVDPDGLLEALFWSRAPKDGVHLEIGAGQGFHALRYTAHASQVFALEPAPAALAQLYARLASEGRPDNLTVLGADAEAIPLDDHTVDVAVARFAYFFGTEACLPGLAEVRRVLKPGGHLFIVDNDVRVGQFGELCKAAYPHWSSDEAMERQEVFYRQHGLARTTVLGRWRAPDRDSLRRVLRMEFLDLDVQAHVASLARPELSYGFAVWHASW